jgi:ribonuclease Z
MIQGYRRTDGSTETPGGHPLPLTGKPLTETPVVVKKEGVPLKEYSEICIPAREELGEDEMRLICIGSGNPPVRRAQAATGWLVQLGNGDNFIFDVGGGTVQNLWSLEIHPAYLDKLFLTHLHLDHVGDWGPSGNTPELGTAAFCDNMRKAAYWHTQSKRGFVPSGGMEIVAHEFDVSPFSPDNPRILVYDENDVKIYAFPVAHILIGAVGYRLEWKGLSMTFHGDGEPCTFEAEQAAGADVFMHEAFLDAMTFSRKMNLPLPIAQNVAGAHSTPDRLGKLYAIAQPNLGVAYHYFHDDETIDPFFDNVKETYDGPVLLAQDLTCINVTPEQIVMRQAQTDLLHWTPPGPKKEGPPQLDPKSPGPTEDFVAQTILPPED